MLPELDTPRRAYGVAATATATAALERPIVTGQGVRLELHPAGLASRVAAGLIDLAAIYGLLTVGGVLIALAGQVLGPVATVIGLSVLWGVSLLGYPVAFETRWGGATPGKAALGLRVVTVEGAPIGLRAAAIRGALLTVDALLVPLGALWSLAQLSSKQGRRLGDVAAGTVVVRDRHAGGIELRPIAFLPPASLVAYRDQLDVGRLDAEGYRLIRSVLLRQGQLTAAARHRLTLDAALVMTTRLGHPVVSTVTAEQYLVCVASAYQLRHRGFER